MLIGLSRILAIVSCGHPWLQQSVLCQPCGMLAAQKDCGLPDTGLTFQHFEHIRVPVMCQMLHPQIIILPTADPEVAMATVSVIVSVVLADCSYGNNVCNSSLVQIKPLQMRDPLMRGAPGNGRVVHGHCHCIPSFLFKLVHMLFTEACGLVYAGESEPTDETQECLGHFDRGRNEREVQ